MNVWLLDRLEYVDPARLALEDDDVSWTYGQLKDRARTAGGVLVRQYGPGRYIVIPMRPGAPSVALLLGVMYAGCTPVPVDPELPPAALQYIVEKSGAVGIVDPARPDLWEDGPSVDLAGRSDMPALVLFTSGTTGHPKGVVVSHANLEHSCSAISEYLDYPQWNSAAVVLPLHYSYGLVSQVLCQLSVGGRVVVFPTMRNPVKVARRVESLGLASFCGVPSTFHALGTIHGMTPIAMPSVRVVCSAGAALDRTRLGVMRDIFPSAVIFNNYGMTEAAPRIAYIRDDDPRFGEATCGKPMRGVEVRVVDPATWQPLPDGEAGMLVVRGPNVTAGYLNDPELTAAAFTPDGFLISGDMAALRDGYIYISGRYDDVFNVGGEKVSPLEVEHAVAQHPAVEQVVVRGVADAQRGAVPVAFVRLRAPVTRRELMASAREHVTPIRIPTRFLEVRGFPMTSNGKVQRRLLTADDPEWVIREIE
ncbi:class I adenylate-forming enzyme family protein [Luteitalea sp. TBR-22]|uniref:class I adenylate-forming enzyme family protein n=1 Tax=Luteitalea sp. TBR-22 TaxID=2802971 RepID=UPI001EF619B8|nr:class I adenylate-forming enzyme family protein [Luteitalea sp. TBR-22]